MSSEITYPDSRALLLDYVGMLADPVELHACWSRASAPSSFFESQDEFWLLLCPEGFDGSPASPGAFQSVGEVLYPEEAPLLDFILRTWDAIDDVRDRRLDEVAQARQVLDDPRWPSVEKAAREAFARMRANDTRAAP